MVTPTTRSVVLVSFPFSDLSRSKLRPAVVLAYAGRDDWILCQITSKSYGDTRVITLDDDSFATGSLRVVRGVYRSWGSIVKQPRITRIAQIKGINNQ